MILGIYGLVWGVLQPITGKLTDNFGRDFFNIWGMWICGVGVLSIVYSNGFSGQLFSAAISAVGMAMLYPSLSASIADKADKRWRGVAIGIYRFWRDLGYAIGGLCIGLILHFTHTLNPAFWFVAISMFISGAVLSVCSKKN